jgi:hypothetical protein
MSENVTVYQVRAVNVRNHQRIVHAYTTEAEAKTAMAMMKKSQGRYPVRYISVPVVNNPSAHWGINFPVEPTPKKKK